jgi:type I restriction enzyme S subunit
VTAGARQLHEFCRIIQGGRSGLSGNDFVPSGVPAYGAGGLNGYLPMHEFNEPAVILSSIGARCGKCFYADGKWASLANTQLIFPDPQQADARFLWFQLNDEARWHRSGTGQPFIKPSDVKAHRVYLPALAEQRRIAEVLGRAEALRTKRRAALAQLDSLTQSLFLDLFGDPATNPKNWPVRQIGDLLESATYGTSEKAGASGEYPVLRMNNLTRTGEMDFTDLKFMDLEAKDRERYLVADGDVLFNRTNSADLVGKTAVFRANRPMAYAGYLIRLRTTAENDSEFLGAFLNLPYSKRMLRGMCKSIIGMANINASEIQAMRIPQPPSTLQRTFARHVAAVQRLKATHRAALAHLNALFASLQQRAFRGEL